MKRGKFLFFLFLIFSIPIYSFWEVEEGEPNSFRGYTWGMPVYQLYLREYSRTQVKYNGKVVYYTKKNEDLFIGNAKIEKIEYGFWNDEILCEVLVSIRGKENFERIKRICIEKFGKNYRKVPGCDKIVWKGKTTYIFLDFNPTNGKGYLYMSPYPFQKFINTYEEIIANESIRDF